MYKLSLINMPFASLHLPSIALTQLKSILDKNFGNEVSVQVHYLNHDFAQYVGVELHQLIANSLEHHNTGLGDWFFRQSAFPELANNTEEYFQRYYLQRDAKTQMMKRFLEQKRNGLDDFLHQLIDRYQLDQANVVGLTSMFSQNVACFAMAEKLKRVNPNIITIMGGANCETPMGQEIARNILQIDYVFSGPALKSFPQFIRHCLDNNSDACSEIKGVFSGKKHASKQALPVLGGAKPINAIGEDLDINVDIDLDYGPFLSALENKFPHQEIEPVLLFETSRGCWWGERAHCTFCGLNGQTMKYRAMNADKALALFNSLFKYTPQCTRFSCVDNILPKEYVKEVFPFLKPPSDDVSIFYEVKADLSGEEIGVLEKAGVKVIQPGIESLATSTLKLMKKGTTACQNVMFLMNCVRHDVFPYWNILVGFPGEDEDVYEKYIHDLPLLKHLPPPNGVFPVRFDRYSPYYVQAKQYELDLHPLDCYKLIYPLDEASLSNLAYYFADRNLTASYFLKMAKWIDRLREKFNQWQNDWYADVRRPQPQLVLKTELNTVFDSRSGEVVEYHVGDVGRQVLECLSTPKRASAVASELSHIPFFDAEKEIDQLQSKGLIFQDRARLLSLVFPENQPESSFRKITGSRLRSTNPV